MKLPVLFILIAVICITACKQQEETVPVDEYDPCDTYLPFYEQQDSNATSLSIECICQDSTINLSEKLAPYTNVTSINFGCDANQFNLIPTMPSITHLSTDVVTGNISAFPNLEVFKNKTYLENPIPYQLSLLPKLREVVLFNALQFPDYFIGEIPLDVFKMTFQNIPSQTISLPANLFTLKNLKELNIRNLEVAIFTDYENLTNLEKLELSGVGRWARIPETPNQWPHLKALEISEVDIRGGGLPDIFGDMDSLKTIHISNTVVSDQTLRNICATPNLKELTLSFCELPSLPNELGDLINLEHLIIITEQNLTINSIVLPLSVNNLINLKTIFISTNTDQFPIALFGLKNNLESITIKDNIENVPSEIGEFTTLKTLKLNNCGLSSLPLEIQNLSSTLEKLHLVGNSFDNATKEQIIAWLPNTTIYF